MNTISIGAAQVAIICLGTTVAMGTDSEQDDWQTMINLQQMLRSKMQHSYETEEEDIIFELTELEQIWFDCAMYYGIVFYTICDNMETDYLLEIAKIVKGDDRVGSIVDYAKDMD